MMPLLDVYINRTSHFFPNDPVSNDEIEAYLGYIDNKPSWSKPIVLHNNGIVNRYYAVRQNGEVTHTNAQMAALAVRGLFDDPAHLKSIDLLSCGTSSPDQLLPSHGAMVHGWLPESRAFEVVSPSGACCAGMHALKYAYMAVRSGCAGMAVAAGSERMSLSLRSEIYEDEMRKLSELQTNPYISFEKDFLRWMLSDGASAVLMSNRKSGNGPSLRVEWIDGVSFAHEMPPCMYMGADKREDGTLRGYAEYSPDELTERSVLSIKQDVRLLGDYIISLGGEALKRVLASRGVAAGEIDYLLPHMSSYFFREKLHDEILALGIGVPYDKWFVNLSTVGNVGAASIYLMLDELFRSGRLREGERILLLVPESARFSYMFALLTVC